MYIDLIVVFFNEGYRILARRTEIVPDIKIQPVGR